MTVQEMTNMVTKRDLVIVRDINSRATLFSEYDFCDESYDNDADWLKYKDLEVISISAHPQGINLFVNSAKTYTTYLDAVYSVKVTLDVPINEDEGDVFRMKGEELLALLPKTLQFGDIVFSLDDDNMQSGSYYDMIDLGAE